MLTMAGGAAGLAVDPLKLWTIRIARIGAKDWSAMQGLASTQIAYSAKSARANEAISTRVANKAARNAIASNSWQNVCPTHIRDYQEWWARVQAV